jgi:hypothetical protein
MFEAGRELSEIVIAVRQPPALVRQLYREWLTDLEQAERERQFRERNRQEREVYERERRERVEDERANIEWTKVCFRGDV